MTDAPLPVDDRRRGAEVRLDTSIAFRPRRSAAPVDLPASALPPLSQQPPAGEAETAEGRAFLALLRDARRRAPDDRAKRLTVAAAWHALTPGARLDVAWALTHEERTWLVLACDERLGLR